MNYEGNLICGTDRSRWGRDVTGMGVFRLLTWKCANHALEDLGLWGLWEMPDELYNKPKELDAAEYSEESELFNYLFVDYWAYYWVKWETEIIPKIDRMQVERAELFEQLPFPDEDQMEDDRHNAHLFAQLPFPDEDRPLPNGYKPSWKSIIAASEEEL